MSVRGFRLSFFLFRRKTRNCQERADIFLNKTVSFCARLLRAPPGGTVKGLNPDLSAIVIPYAAACRRRLQRGRTRRPDPGAREKGGGASTPATMKQPVKHNNFPFWVPTCDSAVGELQMLRERDRSFITTQTERHHDNNVSNNGPPSRLAVARKRSCLLCLIADPLAIWRAPER